MINYTVIRETLDKLKPFKSFEAVDLVLHAYSEFCQEMIELREGDIITDSELRINLESRGYDVGFLIEIIRRTNNETSEFKFYTEDTPDGSDDDGHSQESCSPKH